MTGPVYYDELPPTHALVTAREADLALARRESIAREVPIPDYNGLDVGPTAAWANRYELWAREAAGRQRLAAVLFEIGADDEDDEPGDELPATGVA